MIFFSSKKSKLKIYLLPTNHVISTKKFQSKIIYILSGAKKINLAKIRNRLIGAVRWRMWGGWEGQLRVTGSQSPNPSPPIGCGDPGSGQRRSAALLHLGRFPRLLPKPSHCREYWGRGPLSCLIEEEWIVGWAFWWAGHVMHSIVKFYFAKILG
jgi:hypothetical protein